MSLYLVSQDKQGNDHDMTCYVCCSTHTPVLDVE